MVERWAESDERIKQLMAEVGMPNSMSLYQAFKQLEMETRLRAAAVGANAGAEIVWMQDHLQAMIDADWTLPSNYKNAARAAIKGPPSAGAAVRAGETSDEKTADASNT